MVEFKLRGMPVWVYSKNVDDKTSVATSRLVEGSIGDTFKITPEEIDGYQFVEAEGTQTGVFNDTTQQVTFYYRPAAVLEAEPLTDKYLALTMTAPTYQTFEGLVDGQKVWADSYVKVVERVATKSGDFWYQLADSRWVLYDTKAMSLISQTEMVAEQKRQQELQGPVLTVQTIAAIGRIDYVAGREISVYDQPYGKEVARVLNGKEVTLTQQATDDAGITWYEAPDYGWIPGHYLAID